jgi:GNS1/SUR4 family
MVLGWHPTYPENCIQYSADSHYPYEDISCLLTHDASLRYLAPLAKTYMDWEFLTRLEAPSWKTIIGTVLGSGLIMIVGNVLMYRKRPYAIRNLVTVWNMFWMGVHCLGFFRMLPQVVHNWSHYSVNDNVCGAAQSLWLSGTTGLWGVIWIYIKIIEVLMESVLVVMLKQSCGLLQWFNNYAYVLIHSYVCKYPRASIVLVLSSTNVACLVFLY